MRDFLLPIHPEGLLNCENLDQYQVEKENAPPISSLSEKQRTGLLREIDTKLESPTKIAEQTTFDTLYFLVSQYAELGPATRDQLCDLLVDKAVNLLSLVGERRKRSNEAALHRNALKMYSFLLSWLVTIGEKGSKQEASGAKGRGKKTAKASSESKQEAWDASTKEKVVSGLVQILEGEVGGLWDSGEPEEDWLQLFSKAAAAILEAPANLKAAAVRACVWKLVGLLAGRYNQLTRMANMLLHLAVRYEHFGPHAVELIGALTLDYQQPAIVTALFKEVAEMSSTDMVHNTEGARHIATLLCGIAETQPIHAQHNLHLLLPLLEAEPYSLRNGIVLMSGRILHLGFKDGDALTVPPALNSLDGDDDEDDEGRDHGDDNEAQKEITKEALWGVMEMRFHDVSSYTRSKLIQSWAHLCEHRAIPVELQAKAVGLAGERLRDKAVQVRKNALRLLTSLLQHNPFSPSLQLSSLLKKLPRDMRKKYLQQLHDADAPPADAHIDSEEQQHQEDEECAEGDAEGKRGNASEAKSHLVHAVEFALGLKRCVPLIAQLLLSPNSSEVVEAIHFFVCAQQFALDEAQVGVRKMIELVWSKEASVKQALWDAFRDLYLTAPRTSKSNVAGLYIACKLISLTLSATLAELTSLEQLLSEMKQQGLIAPTVVQTLLDIFDLQVPQVSAVESRGAIIILGMLATASPEIAREHFDLLSSTGLGARAKDDLRLAHHTCIALQKARTLQRARQTAELPPAQTGKAKSSKEKSTAKPAAKAGESKPFDRLPSGHPLFARLFELLVGKPRRIGHWLGLAEQAINTIYALAQAPDVICASVIKSLAALAFDSSDDNADDGDNADDVGSSGANSGMVQTPGEALSRLLLVLGHVSLKQLIHMEQAQAEIHRRRQSPSSRPSSRKGGQEAIELELGVGMAGDDERDVEYIQHLIEHEVVTANLLGTYQPLIHYICTSSTPQGGLVRECAILALCKYMCVSSSFCEKNLQLLFSLLSSRRREDHFEGSQRLRANIIVAVGDLAFRFPNLLEPWTKHIYRPLSDKSMKVRRNAVMVLTHLILNDMVKVKAYIADLALCVHDADATIARMSRLFFHELSQKGAAIYNIIPDVLSRLSAAESVDSDMFKRVMKHLLSLIEKEKQSESLMEKLCHRLRTAKEEEQEDIAYCLTLLNYSEKALRRLIELEKCYSAALINPGVLDHFFVLVGKGRKFGAKGEQRAVADELEKKLAEIVAKNAGDQDDAETAPADMKQEEDEDDEEQDDEEEQDEDAHQEHNGDDDDGDEEVDKKKEVMTMKKNTKTSAKVKEEPRTTKQRTTRRTAGATAATTTTRGRKLPLVKSAASRAAVKKEATKKPTTTRRQAATKGRATKKSQREKEEEEEEEEDDETEEEEEEDDKTEESDDEEEKTKGKKGRHQAKKRQPAADDDDDDEDEGVFDGLDSTDSDE